MIIQRYPDGTELTLGGLAGAIAFGALSTTAVILVREKLETRHWKKYHEEIRKRSELAAK